MARKQRRGTADLTEVGSTPLQLGVRLGRPMRVRLATDRQTDRQTRALALQQILYAVLRPRLNQHSLSSFSVMHERRSYRGVDLGSQTRPLLKSVGSNQ